MSASRAPQLDATIAKALANLYGLPLDPPPGELDAIMAARYERVKVQTAAVRDGLVEKYPGILDLVKESGDA